MRATILLLTLALAVSACSRAERAIEATNSMPQKMDETLAEMKRTNEVVRQQPVQISFENLLSEELGKDLDPIPFDLMPFAQKFGEYAEPKDVVELVYLWMKKLNEMPFAGDASDAVQVEAFNHHKLQIFSALQAVCGFLPQENVDVIIADEIEKDGRFATAAMQLLFLRARFMQYVMLDASLFSEPLDNIGKLEKAIEYTDSIDRIARLPFAKNLTLKITGFLDPYPVVEESFDLNLAPDLWAKIKVKASDGLTVAPKELTGDSRVDQKLYDDRQSRVRKSLEYVDDMINGWTAKP